MDELFIKEGKLVSKQEWEQCIDGLNEHAKEATKEQLAHAIQKAIKDRIPEEKFGLLLSGGVDSSFLALVLAKHTKDFTAITVGIENSPDIEYARKVAKLLGLNHIEKILTLEELEQIIPTVMQITKQKDIVTIGVGAVEVAGLQVAKENNIKVMFGGIGSEEIFAGYQRHATAQDVQKECWDGLRNMYSRDLERDYAIFSHFNIAARTPFMDKEVIRIAMSIDAKKKISKEFKKIILREIAEEAGLSKEIAWRKKKAAQYGSRIVHAIEKLAKRKNLKYKKEYLETIQV